MKELVDNRDYFEANRYVIYAGERFWSRGASQRHI